MPEWPYVPAAPPGAPAVTSRDLEHLGLLSTFHYVLAGITGLFSLFPLLHVGMGVAMLLGRFGGPSSGGSGPTELVAWLFIGMGSAFVVFGETLAVLTFIAGRSIKERKRHTLCLIVAGLHCLNIPLGTALGVPTIVVLTKPHVKALFSASVDANLTASTL